MKLGVVLTVCAKGLNALSGVRNVVGGAGSIGQQQERQFVSWLFVEDLHGSVARLGISTTCKKELGKLKLYFRIVRL